MIYTALIIESLFPPPHNDHEQAAGLHGCQMAIARFLDWKCLALRPTLQNLTPSFPWIAPPRPPLWRNPRKGRDRILPSGNLADDHAPAGRRSCKCAPFSPMSHRHNSRFNLIRPLSLASLSPLITFAFAPMDLKSRALSPAPPPVSETNGEIRHEIKRGKNNTCDFAYHRIRSPSHLSPTSCLKPIATVCA